MRDWKQQLWRTNLSGQRTGIDNPHRTVLSMWTFVTSRQARILCNVRNFPAACSFRFRCDSGRADVPDCGWNCELTSDDNQPIFSTLAIILDCVLDNDIASRFAGCPADSIALAFTDERRLRRRRSRTMSTLPLKATAEAEFPHSVKLHYQRRQQQLLWRWKRCPRAVNVNSHQPAAGDANRDAFRDA